jgi:hypothetical protein
LRNIKTLFSGILNTFESCFLAGIFAVFIHPSQEFKMIPWMKVQSFISPHRSTYINANTNALISNLNGEAIFLGGKGRPAHKTDNLTDICEPIV